MWNSESNAAALNLLGMCPDKHGHPEWLRAGYRQQGLARRLGSRATGIASGIRVFQHTNQWSYNHGALDLRKRVSATEIILILLGIIGLVLGIVAAGQAFERRAARKLVSPLLGRPCPSCGNSFHPDAIRSARLEHGFDGPSYASLVCPVCSKRLALLQGELMEDPSVRRPDAQRAGGVDAGRALCFHSGRRWPGASQTGRRTNLIILLP